jgi:sigma-B regulation protein RsbU (phosphoserine phosphatase)
MMKKRKDLEDELSHLRASVEELTVLNDLAVSVSGTMEVDDVLDQIVEKSIKSLKAEQGSILLVTEQERTPLKTLVRQINNTSLMSSYKVGSHITGWVLQNKQPLIIENLSTDSRFVTTKEEKEHIKSVICVPISVSGELIGVLMLTNKKVEGTFTSEDLRLLSILAAQSGQLIKNSWLQEEALIKRSIEKELEVARDIQNSLLPQTLPQIDGLEIANYFQSASQVAGDYYDFFNIGEYKTGIILADVSGHGPSAALIMTMLKGVLHSLAPRHDSIDKIVTEINSTLNPIIPPEIFITLALLLFDMKSKKIIYTNAGHTPIIHINKRMNIFEIVKLTGCAINVTSKPEYTQIEIPFEADSIFVIYTDGIIESANEAEELFGIERLSDTVKEYSKKHAEDIKDQIVRRINDFSSGKIYNDDSAMIVLKVV